MLYHGILMAIYFKIEGALIVFFGDTYNHRPAIKNLGGRYNGTDKTWVVHDSAEMREKAAQFAKGHGISAEVSPAPVQSLSSAQVRSVPSINPALDPAPASPIDPSLGMTVSQLLLDAEKINYWKLGGTHKEINSIVELFTNCKKIYVLVIFLTLF